MARNRKNLAALKSIAEILNQSLDMSQALDQSLKIILDILGLPTAWVFLKKSRDEAFYLAAHQGLPPGLHASQKVWCGGCQCNSLARNGKLTNAVNMVKCSRLEMAEGDIDNLEVHASVPLQTPRSQIGIFNVAASDGSHFSEQNLQLLAAVGNQMGVAIERARMFDQIRNQRNREQVSLLKLSRALLNAPSLEHVLNEIVRVSRQVFKADMCLISLHAQAREQLTSDLKMAGTGFPIPLDDERFEDCWRGNASQKLEALGRPGHILLDEDSSSFPEIHLFPLEEPVDSEDITLIREDLETWRFCRDLGARSILIAPIRSVTGGEVLGTLSVAHRHRMELAADSHLTELLANQAALAIEQARLNQIRAAQKDLERELSMARDIQAGFLPKITPQLEGWQLASRYEAAHQVGGDFYDFIELGHGRMGLVVADVSGKGVPAALIMAVSKILVRAISLEKATPLEAILTVNKNLMAEYTSDRFLSLFYSELQPKTGVLTYVRAGHNPPLHWSEKQRRVLPLEGSGMVLGVADLPVFEEQSVQLDPGDVVVFYTDGLTEAMDAQRREYTETRLARYLADHHDRPAEALAGAIQQDVAQFVNGAPPTDDFTLVVLKRLASHSS